MAEDIECRKGVEWMASTEGKGQQSNKVPVFLPNSSARAHLSNALTLSRKFAHPQS